MMPNYSWYLHGQLTVNVSCKLHPYSLHKTRSLPGPHLPKRIRNMHPHNYYDLKGKDIDLASFVCDMNSWLSCRVSALQSVIAGLISSSEDHGIHS